MWGIPKSKMHELASFLSKEYDVIAPIETRDTTGFGLFDAGSALFLKDRPHYGPKGFLFMHNEEMFSYSGGKVHTREKKKDGPFLLFCARPCDANAVEVLDDFFLSGCKDTYYAAERKDIALVVLACPAPCENGFCDSVGADRVDKYDLMLWEGGDYYAAAPGSLRGDRMVSESGLFEKIAKSEPCEIKCKSRVEKDPVINERTLAREAEKCFACCACTAVCPTCTCFDIVERKELTGKRECVRKRKWDWCMSSDFTTISGICFRTTKKAMLRQFINHKLRDFKAEHGRHMCVGCGRCISHCPAYISIVNIVRKDDAAAGAAPGNGGVGAKENAKADAKK